MLTILLRRNSPPDIHPRSNSSAYKWTKLLTDDRILISITTTITVLPCVAVLSNDCGMGDSVHPRNHSIEKVLFQVMISGVQKAPQTVWWLLLAVSQSLQLRLLLKTLHFGQRTWKAPAGATVGLLPELWLLQC